MFYVYLLHSLSSDEWYVGSTSNLRGRLWQHNHGKSFATKSGVPWRLKYYEAYPTEHAAKLREQKLKHHGKGLSELKRRIQLG